MTPHQCVYIWLKAFHLTSIFHTFDQIQLKFLRSNAINFLLNCWQLSLRLWHHTFQYIFASHFPSQTSFRSKAFQLFLLLEIDVWGALLKKKKKCEEIYRHKFTYVSRSSKTIEQSFMTSLKIYLQKSNVDF